MANIAFIGLGQMGLPMATNLVAVGHSVIGYDLSPLQLGRLQSVGGRIAKSAADAVLNADFIITCLPDAHALRGFWLDGSDIGQTLGKGTIAIDCSTVGVEEIRAISSALESLGVPLLDAAVLGDPADAKKRMITIVVGGSLAAYALAAPILEDMSERVIHAGRSGHGQAAALCVQMMTAINIVGVAEAFALAERLGLGAEKLFAAAALSSASSWALAERCPQSGLVPHSPSNNLFQAGIPAEQMHRQMSLLSILADRYGARAPLTKAVEQLYDEFCANKNRKLDYSAIIQLLRQR